MRHILGLRKVTRRAVQRRAQISRSRTVVVERRLIKRHPVGAVVHRRAIHPTTARASRRPSQVSEVSAVMSSDCSAVVDQHLVGAVILVQRPNALDVAGLCSLVVRRNAFTQRDPPSGIDRDIQQVRRLVEFQIKRIGSVIQPAPKVVQGGQAVTCRHRYRLENHATSVLVPLRITHIHQITTATVQHHRLRSRSVSKPTRQIV